MPWSEPVDPAGVSWRDRWPRRSTVIAVVAVVVAVALGALVALEAGGVIHLRHRSHRSTGILLVGDSITYLSAPQIIDALHPADLHFIAKPGYRTDQLLPIMQDRIDHVMDAPRASVAVLVGYNDIFQSTIGDPALTAMVRAASRFRCAVFLTLPAHTGVGAPSLHPYAPGMVAFWNARLRKEVARYRNVHLALDWQSAVDTGSAADSLLQPRDVHPLPAGRVRVADAYRRSLARFC